MFFFRRPKPKHERGQLVLVCVPLLLGGEYLLIRHRRYIRPNGMSEKCWVYEGPVYVIKNEGRKALLRRATDDSCFPESWLWAIGRGP